MKEERTDERVYPPEGESPDIFIVEVGSSLVYLLRETGNSGFIPRVMRIRDELQKEWGLELPDFLIKENMDLTQTAYRFLLAGREIIRRMVPPGKMIIITSKEKLAKIQAKIESDPIYQRPCVWVDPGDSHLWQSPEPYSATTQEVILEHMETILRSHASYFVHPALIRTYLEKISETTPDIVNKTLDNVSFAGLVNIMKNLVPEGIPLSEFQGVLNALAHFDGKVDLDTVTESLRNIFRDNIHNFVFSNRLLLFVVPDAKIQLWIYQNSTKLTRKDPTVNNFINELTNLHISFQRKGFRLGVICCKPVRLALRKIIEQYIPDVVVLKPEEILPDRNIMIIKKINGGGIRLWLAWHWFWLTGSAPRKKIFRNGLNSLANFIKRKKEKPPTFREPEKSFFQPAEEPVVSRNLPIPAAVNVRQKLALQLLDTPDVKLKELFSLLELKTVMLLGREMASLPLNIRNMTTGETPGTPPPEVPDFLSVYINNLYPKNQVPIELNPAQKMAVILSMLNSRASDIIFKEILLDMSRVELENLIMEVGNYKIASNRDLKHMVMEDFLWFVKGSIFPGVIYDQKLWNSELQRIVLRSPRKVAVALKELWLEWSSLSEKFELYCFRHPQTASFWIRGYINSVKKNEVSLHYLEKAAILLQLLPMELAESVLKNLEPGWNKVLKNIPREPVDPIRAGIVLSQFLSHYYSCYDRSFSSGMNVN